MYNPETDLLFPQRSLPALGSLRGSVWQNLVAIVFEAGADSIEQMAFILMMARLNNCTTCNADSFRAMSGCAICATISLKRFHETDDALASLFQTARGEVEQYLKEKNFPLSR